MKILKNNILPIILTFAIAAAVFFGIRVVKDIIPMGIDEVKSYEKIPGNNQVLYIEDEEEFVLYPWNYYNEEKAEPYDTDKLFDGWLEHKGLNEEKTEYEYDLEKCLFFENYLKDFVKNCSGKTIVSMKNLDESIKTVNEKENTFVFVDHLKVIDDGGNIYYLDMAFLQYAPYVYYYHLIPASIREIDNEKLEEENNINELLNMNALDMFLENIYRTELGVVIKSVVTSALYDYGEISCFSYQNEILIAYTLRDIGQIRDAYYNRTQYDDEFYIDEHTEDQASKVDYMENYLLYMSNYLNKDDNWSPGKNSTEGVTLILFYDVQNGEISGFSWQ